MPADNTFDTPHQLTQRPEGYRAWCWNKPRWPKPYMVAERVYHIDGTYHYAMKRIDHGMSLLCRQMGDLPECKDCDPALRDWEYINKMKAAT
jgi:hypothetical protein